MKNLCSYFIGLIVYLFKRAAWPALIMTTIFIVLCTGSCTQIPKGTEQEDSTSAAEKKPTNVTLFMEVNEDYSCPFLFIWNGAEYILENDIYSVARSQSREYTDYLFIQNKMAPQNNHYTFRILERENEESNTDVIGLIIIDHDSDVKVGTDSNGNIHSYKYLMPPVSAHDENGTDVLSLVRSEDELNWHAEHNRSIVLDFSSIDISAGAKLVLRADGFEGDLIGGKTEQIPALLIQTFESGEWVTRHKFFPKDLWATGVFDIQEHLKESKQVRLVSISCHYGKYHFVDMVALNNTPDNFEAITINPEAAILNGDKSVLKALLSSDNEYVFTEKGDYIDITFPCPHQDRSERSFVLISEGYYRAAGNTFYIYTKNENGWELRYDFEPLNYQMDTLTDVDLSKYLPDVDGEYKIKIEHLVQPGVQQSAEGNLDFIYLLVEDDILVPSSAFNNEGFNILEQILEDDDVYWLATEQTAIVHFENN